MGDHRANVKIEFTFHGETHKADMWINWDPNDSGVDPRIIEWFSGYAAEGYARFYQRQQEDYALQHAKEIEESERKQLAVLKSKYEPESAA